MASNSIGVSTIMVVNLKAEKPIRPRVRRMVEETPMMGNREPRQLRNSNQRAAMTMAKEMTNSHHLLTRSASIQARK